MRAALHSSQVGRVIWQSCEAVQRRKFFFGGRQDLLLLTDSAECEDGSSLRMPFGKRSLRFVAAALFLLCVFLRAAVAADLEDSSDVRNGSDCLAGLA